MSSKQTTAWSVRPGYAFTAGAGVGAGLFVFEFWNEEENPIYGMAFSGLGLGGGPGSGGVSTVREVIKKLATQVATKGAGAIYGLGTGTPPGYKEQRWTLLHPNKPFSSEDLSGSSGRVTILGASVFKTGLYGCYISASDGVVSWTPLFGSVSVDVQPQNFDLQIGVILGFWWEAFSIPKD
jgi:hypothetical protein